MSRRQADVSWFVEMFEEFPFNDLQEFAALISKISGLKEGSCYQNVAKVLRDRQCNNERLWLYMNEAVRLKNANLSEEDLNIEIARIKAQASSLNRSSGNILPSNETIIRFLADPSNKAIIRLLAETDLTEGQIALFVKLTPRLTVETYRSLLEDPNIAAL